MHLKLQAFDDAVCRGVVWLTLHARAGLRSPSRVFAVNIVWLAMTMSVFSLANDGRSMARQSGVPSVVSNVAQSPLVHSKSLHV